MILRFPVGPFKIEETDMHEVFEMFDILPSDDMRSYAFRLVHLSILGGLIGFAAIVLLLALIIYLVFSVRAASAKLSAVEAKLHRIESKLARALGPVEGRRDAS